MGFELATAGRILFGAGTARELPAIAASFGTRVLLVHGCGRELGATMLASLRASGLALEALHAEGEPTLAAVTDAAELARQHRVEVVVAVGGGSAIDLGKAAAALAANGGEPLDYLEVVGRGQPLTKRSVPLVAVPTTAGTGSEVTRNAVVHCPAEQVKASLRSPLMLPAVALVDPELTASLSPALTASTGLDALTQLIEPFVSKRANPLVDGICREAIPRAARGLAVAWRDGRDLRAREDMAFASLCGGIALANAALGAVHGLAAPLGGALGARHGVLCACLLPHVMQMNVTALRERSPGAPALGRFDELARLLTGSAEATADDAIAWIRKLVSELGIPPLGALGLERSLLGPLVKQAERASSMKGNPILLADHEIEAILERAS